MTRENWYAQGHQDKFKELISDPLFDEAAIVIFGDLMRTVVEGSDINAHALANTFRQGGVWALGQFRLLAVTPVPREMPKTLRPWDKKHPEVEELYREAYEHSKKE